MTTTFSDDDWDRFDDDLAAHMAAQLLDTDPPGTMREAKVGSSVPTPEPPASAIEILSVTLEASDWWATPSLTQVEDPPTEPPVPVVTVQPVPEPVNERPETPKGRLGSAVLLAFVALAGLALRVANLNVVGLNSDESVYAGQGGALLEVGALPEHFSIFRAHPLLLQFTMGVVFRIAGQSDLAARLTVAVVFGLGSVGVSYLLARELYGHRIALASAAVLATMPYHVVVSRQVLVDAPMAFFAVVGIYFAARVARTRQRRDLYLSFFACALAAVSKEIAVLLVPVLFAWLTLGPARVRWTRFFGPSLVFAAIGLPFPLTRLINQPGNASQFFLWQFARAPNHSPDYFLNVLLQFAGWGIVLAMTIGFAGLVLRRNSADQLLLWWLGTFGLFFQFWPTKLFPYLFLILPGMVIAAVAAIAELSSRIAVWARRTPAWGTAGFAATNLALVLALGIGSTGIVTAGPAAELEGFGDFDIEVQTFAGSREFGQWAGENTPENARFITIGPSLGNILRFYGARDSVALSVSTDPAKRNPAYVPIENPDLAMRQMSVHYIVWDAYSADRSAFYNNRLRGYARKLGGEIVFSAWAEDEELIVAAGPPPDGVEVRIVVWDVPGAGSTTGGRREAGLS